MGVPPAGGLAFFTAAAAAAVIGPLRLERLPGVGRVAGWLRARPELPRGTGRPIELIASDVRRLGRRFHHVPPRLPFARFEGLRRAYDTVLTEACQALEVEHLLGVLPPGPELDAERRRVEVALYRWGFELDDVL